jgi:hypothetical protein
MGREQQGERMVSDAAKKGGEQLRRRQKKEREW